MEHADKSSVLDSDKLRFARRAFNSDRPTVIQLNGVSSVGVEGYGGIIAPYPADSYLRSRVEYEGAGRESVRTYRGQAYAFERRVKHRPSRRERISR